MKKLQKWFNGLIGTYKALIIVGCFVVGIRSWELIHVSKWLMIPCWGGMILGLLFTVFYCLDHRE